MTYDIKYNIIDGYTLDQCFTNSKELREYEEKEGLTKSQMEEYALTIPYSIAPQFIVTEWDEENRDEFGTPEYIQSMNLAEWIYEG